MPPSRTRLFLQHARKRLARILPLFAGMFLLVTLALYLLERNAPDTKFKSYADAIWFGVVTLSTVGYGDAYPVTTAGRLITGGFILFTLGTVGLLLTAISEALLEVKRMDELGLVPTRMENHTLVLGFGQLARTAIEELLASGTAVAVLCERAEDVPLVRQVAERGGTLHVSFGEPSPLALVERLNAHAARTAVVALDDDAKGLIACLNLRAANPGLRIVCALQREELRETLIASGVTYVATPNELAGRLVASAAFEPEVAALLEDLASGAHGACDIRQREAGTLGGLTGAEVRRRLDEEEGPLLLGIARQGEGGREILPHPERGLVVQKDDLLIVLTRKRGATVAGAAVKRVVPRD